MATSCDIIRERLSTSLDGELGPESAAEVRDHLEGCAACRAELESLRLTVGALRRLPDLPPPAGILAGVRTGLAPAPWHRRLNERLGRGWLVGVPIGAFATLLVVVGLALFQARYPSIRRESTRPPAPEFRPAIPQIPPPTFSGMEAPAVRKDVSAPVTAAKIAPPAAKPGAVAARSVVRPAPTIAPPAVSPAAPPAAPLAVSPIAPPAAGPMANLEDTDRLESSPTTQPPRVAEAPAPFADEKKEARLEEKNAPPPKSFLIPEPEPSTAPRVATSRESRDTRENAAERGAYAVPAPGNKMAPETPSRGARIAGSVIAPRSATPLSAGLPASGESAQPSPGIIRRSLDRTAVIGTDKAKAPEKEPIEVLYVFSQDGNDIEELRHLLKHEGGRLLEVRALDSRTSQEAFRPLQNQAAGQRQVTRGWEIQAKVPRRNFGRFLSAVQGRPGYQLLQRQAVEPPAKHPTEHQNIRINLFR